MIGLIILTFIPLVVIVGFLIRIRAEQKARAAADAQVATLQARSAEQERHMREVYPVFAHELRSPISAILGYEELLGDGTLGTVDPRALDALRRIRAAALQLSDLADGIDRLGRDSGAHETGMDVDARDIIAEAVRTVAREAEARDISLSADRQTVMLHTRSYEASRAVALALGAAIKVSPGATLRISADQSPAIRIAGSRLNASTDSPAAADPRSTGHLTGAGLRLAFAAAAARLAGGSLTLEGDAAGAEVRIDLPDVVD